MSTRAGNDWTHIERTEKEPRQEGLFNFKISSISTETSNVKLVRLSPTSSIPLFTYLPGQWVDLYIKTIQKPGGFTITSWPPPISPSESLVLAIQKAESNPVARWFWNERDYEDVKIVGEEVGIRVGGSFVYPPPPPMNMNLKMEENRNDDKITDVVFVAGGVGINPFIPMLQYMRENSILDRSSSNYQRVSVLYSTRASSLREIHFYEELRKLVRPELFLTAPNVEEFDGKDYSSGEIEVKRIRIELRDVLRHVEKGRREGTLVYVCGPQRMTDSIVEGLEGEAGLEKERVLCEKWW